MSSGFAPRTHRHRHQTTSWPEGRGDCLRHTADLRTVRRRGRTKLQHIRAAPCPLGQHTGNLSSQRLVLEKVVRPTCARRGHSTTRCQHARRTRRRPRGLHGSHARRSHARKALKHSWLSTVRFICNTRGGGARQANTSQALKLLRKEHDQRQPPVCAMQACLDLAHRPSPQLSQHGHPGASVQLQQASNRTPSYTCTNPW